MRCCCSSSASILPLRRGFNSGGLPIYLTPLVANRSS
jgi:hypothetical protein